MRRLIDGQELREAMYHAAFETDSDEQRWDSGCWIRYKLFERVLDSLPSAEPERKRGKWIKGTVRHKITGELRPALRCSFCGLSLFNEYESEERDEDFVPKYCPECGADMRTPTQVQLDETDDVMMGGDDGKTD